MEKPGKGRGIVVPVVDPRRCEAKGPCVQACPYDVFEIRPIDPADFERLSFFGKLRNRAHGSKLAYTPRAAACEACGLCVKACPERAIRLVRVDRVRHGGVHAAA